MDSITIAFRTYKLITTVFVEQHLARICLIAYRKLTASESPYMQVQYFCLGRCAALSDNPNKWLRNQNSPKFAVKSVAAKPGSVYHYQSPSSAAAEGHVELNIYPIFVLSHTFVLNMNLNYEISFPSPPYHEMRL